MYEYGILKPVQAILRRGRRRIMEEMNQTGGTLYTYMEISQ
jgi:hypothetical protein